MPMVVGELFDAFGVKPDPAKKWRVVRIVTIGVILAKEFFWSKKIGREREESHERAMKCAEELAGACGSGRAAL